LPFKKERNGRTNPPLSQKSDPTTMRRRKKKDGNGVSQKGKEEEAEPELCWSALKKEEKKGNLTASKRTCTQKKLWKKNRILSRLKSGRAVKEGKGEKGGQADRIGSERETNLNEVQSGGEKEGTSIHDKDNEKGGPLI